MQVCEKQARSMSGRPTGGTGAGAGSSPVGQPAPDAGDGASCTASNSLQVLCTQCSRAAMRLGVQWEGGPSDTASSAAGWKAVGIATRCVQPPATPGNTSCISMPLSTASDTPQRPYQSQRCIVRRPQQQRLARGATTSSGMGRNHRVGGSTDAQQSAQAAIALAVGTGAAAGQLVVRSAGPLGSLWAGYGSITEVETEDGQLLIIKEVVGHGSH